VGSKLTWLRDCFPRGREEWLDNLATLFVVLVFVLGVMITLFLRVLLG
jgi:hypothetical protein